MQLFFNLPSSVDFALKKENLHQKDFCFFNPNEYSLCNMYSIYIYTYYFISLQMFFFSLHTICIHYAAFSDRLRFFELNEKLISNLFINRE